jgi:hypothetical protein
VIVYFERINYLPSYSCGSMPHTSTLEGATLIPCTWVLSLVAVGGRRQSKPFGLWWGRGGVLTRRHVASDDTLRCRRLVAMAAALGDGRGPLMENGGGGHVSRSGCGAMRGAQWLVLCQ